MQLPINERKFRSLSPKLQHKHAAQLLKRLFQEKLSFDSYEKIAEWMSLSPLENVEERYTFHIRLAGIEYDFPSRHYDRLNAEEYLPINIYLDSLRSAYNVGSIIRTTEAMRLGTLHFGNNTPTPNNPKVEKTAMGCAVPFFINTPLEELRRPLIAIETTEKAIPLYTYTFPNSFSLLLGNEARGLSKACLTSADEVVQIPLYGSKNSLNVSIAFAIIAYEIRNSHYAKMRNQRMSEAKPDQNEVVRTRRP